MKYSHAACVFSLVNIELIGAKNKIYCRSLTALLPLRLYYRRCDKLSHQLLLLRNPKLDDRAPAVAEQQAAATRDNAAIIRALWSA